MSGLAALQRAFLDSIFTRDAGSDPGLEVYRRSVLGNLRGALAAAYPVVRRLVGDAFFDAAAERHAREEPSVSGDLGEYGARFGDLLARYAPAAPLDYLPDVARLEWAVHESGRAADAEAFDFTVLARIPEDQRGKIALRPHPALRLLRSPHPVLAIWEANQPARDGTPDRLDGPDHVLVRRIGLAAQPERIDAREWPFLEAIASGAALEDAAARLADAGTFAAAFARLAGEGMLAALEPPGPA